MRENPFQDPYDLGYADGKYMAEQRIAELEAENKRLREGLNTVIVDWQQDGTVYEEYIHALLGG